MAGNNRIQFLRGNSITTAQESLLYGQPCYDENWNLLYVGNSDEADIAQLEPIRSSGTQCAKQGGTCFYSAYKHSFNDNDAFTLDILIDNSNSFASVLSGAQSLTFYEDSVSLSADSGLSLSTEYGKMELYAEGISAYTGQENFYVQSSDTSTNWLSLNAGSTTGGQVALQTGDLTVSAAGSLILKGGTSSPPKFSIYNSNGSAYSDITFNPYVSQSSGKSSKIVTATSVNALCAYNKVYTMPTGTSVQGRQGISNTTLSQSISTKKTYICMLCDTSTTGSTRFMFYNTLSNTCSDGTFTHSTSYTQYGSYGSYGAFQTISSNVYMLQGFGYLYNSSGVSKTFSIYWTNASTFTGGTKLCSFTVPATSVATLYAGATNLCVITTPLT